MLIYLFSTLSGCTQDCAEGYFRQEDGNCYEQEKEQETSDTTDTSVSDTGDTEIDSGDTSETGDTGVELLPGPKPAEIQGELSAGHPRPVWIWSFPDPVDEIEIRVDEGSWQTAGGQQGTHTPDPLDAGTHLFEIRARDEGTEWTSSSFETIVEYHTVNSGYWTGVQREFTKSPLGHPVGVACHNCYDDGLTGDNLQLTKAIISQAIADGADLIELDIKVQGGIWYAEHDDAGYATGAELGDVLELQVLKQADQPLFIEMKERNPTLGQVSQFIEMLTENGYAVNGRPVVLRTFPSRIDNFIHAEAVLADLPFHSPYFRFHMIYNTDEAADVESFQSLISAAHLAGYHGVEFGRQTPNLFSLIHKAQALSLSTGMWTVPESMGEIYCAGFRDVLDAIITDYPIEDCKTVAEENTNILHMDVTNLPPGSAAVEYFYDGDKPGAHNVGGTGEPEFGWSSDGILTGGFLKFNPDLEQSMVFHDGDNDPDDGYFVMAVVQMDKMSGSGWDIQAMVSKADSGGFALELENALVSNKLRYGVRVDGSYEYAKLGTGNLSENKLHLIIGTFDGNGKVRLWVDGSAAGVDESGVLSQGVEQNNVPIRIGADPEGSGGARYYFDGKIQRMTVLKWRDHQN